MTTPLVLKNHPCWRCKGNAWRRRPYLVSRTEFDCALCGAFMEVLYDADDPMLGRPAERAYYEAVTRGVRAVSAR